MTLRTSVLPLREVLRREMPARVRPPGEFAIYSNHGVGLAGYVVVCIALAARTVERREYVLEQ